MLSMAFLNNIALSFRFRETDRAQLGRRVSLRCGLSGKCIFPLTGIIGVLSSEEKGTRLLELEARGFVRPRGWVARGFGAGDPRNLDRWHAALEGAGGVWVDVTGPAVLDGWHAALEGARTIWMGGTRLRSWGLGAAWSLVGWRARGHNLDGWYAGQELGELGARGVWMGGTRWSRAPAVLMHVPGTFNIDGLSAGWVTIHIYIC